MLRPKKSFDQLWMLVGAIALAFFLLLLMGILIFLGNRRPAPAQPPAVLEIIPARTNTPQPAAALDATPASSDSDSGNQHGVGFSIGSYVQVSDTGGDGLRLRNQPGLAGSVLMVASDAEVFKLEDGPIEIDGYTWWYLVGPFDETRKGWGVDNYLELIQNP